MGNQSRIYIDFEPKGLKNITRDVMSLEKEAGKVGLDSSFIDQLNKVTEMATAIKKELADVKMNKNGLDEKGLKKVKEVVTKQTKELDLRITTLETTVNGLMDTLNASDKAAMITLFENLKSSASDATVEVKGLAEAAQQVAKTTKSKVQLVDSNSVKNLKVVQAELKAITKINLGNYKGLKSADITKLSNYFKEQVGIIKEQKATIEKLSSSQDESDILSKVEAIKLLQTSYANLRSTLKNLDKDKQIRVKLDDQLDLSGIQDMLDEDVFPLLKKSIKQENQNIDNLLSKIGSTVDTTQVDENISKLEETILGRLSALEKKVLKRSKDKNGAISIEVPMSIAEDSELNLQGEALKIIDTLSDKLKDHPISVDLDINLNTEWANRKTRSSLSYFRSLLEQDGVKLTKKQLAEIDEAIGNVSKNLGSEIELNISLSNASKEVEQQARDLITELKKIFSEKLIVTPTISLTDPFGSNTKVIKSMQEQLGNVSKELTLSIEDLGDNSAMKKVVDGIESISAAIARIDLSGIKSDKINSIIQSTQQLGHVLSDTFGVALEDNVGMTFTSLRQKVKDLAEQTKNFSFKRGDKAKSKEALDDIITAYKYYKSIGGKRDLSMLSFDDKIVTKLTDHWNELSDAEKEYEMRVTEAGNKRKIEIDVDAKLKDPNKFVDEINQQISNKAASINVIPNINGLAGDDFINDIERALIDKSVNVKINGSMNGVTVDSNYINPVSNSTFSPNENIVVDTISTGVITESKPDSKATTTPTHNVSSIESDLKDNNTSSQDFVYSILDLLGIDELSSAENSKVTKSLFESFLNSMNAKVHTKRNTNKTEKKEGHKEAIEQDKLNTEKLILQLFNLYKQTPIRDNTSKSGITLYNDEEQSLYDEYIESKKALESRFAEEIQIERQYLSSKDITSNINFNNDKLKRLQTEYESYTGLIDKTKQSEARYKQLKESGKTDEKTVSEMNKLKEDIIKSRENIKKQSALVEQLAQEISSETGESIETLKSIIAGDNIENSYFRVKEELDDYHRQSKDLLNNLVDSIKKSREENNIRERFGAYDVNNIVNNDRDVNGNVTELGIQQQLARFKQRSSKKGTSFLRSVTFDSLASYAESYLNSGIDNAEEQLLALFKEAFPQSYIDKNGVRQFPDAQRLFTAVKDRIDNSQKYNDNIEQQVRALVNAIFVSEGTYDRLDYIFSNMLKRQYNPNIVLSKSNNPNEPIMYYDRLDKEAEYIRKEEANKRNVKSQYVEQQKKAKSQQTEEVKNYKLKVEDLMQAINSTLKETDEIFAEEIKALNGLIDESKYIQQACDQISQSASKFNLEAIYDTEPLDKINEEADKLSGKRDFLSMYSSSVLNQKRKQDEIKKLDGQSSKMIIQDNDGKYHYETVDTGKKAREDFEQTQKEWLNSFAKNLPKTAKEIKNMLNDVLSKSLAESADEALKDGSYTQKLKDILDVAAYYDEVENKSSIKKNDTIFDNIDSSSLKQTMSYFVKSIPELMNGLQSANKEYSSSMNVIDQLLDSYLAKLNIGNEQISEIKTNIKSLILSSDTRLNPNSILGMIGNKDLLNLQWLKDFDGISTIEDIVRRINELYVKLEQIDEIEHADEVNEISKVTQAYEHLLKIVTQLYDAENPKANITSRTNQAELAASLLLANAQKMFSNDGNISVDSLINPDELFGLKNGVQDNIFKNVQEIERLKNQILKDPNKKNENSQLIRDLEKENSEYREQLIILNAINSVIKGNQKASKNENVTIEEQTNIKKKLLELQEKMLTTSGTESLNYALDFFKLYKTAADKFAIPETLQFANYDKVLNGRSNYDKDNPFAWIDNIIMRIQSVLSQEASGRESIDLNNPYYAMLGNETYVDWENRLRDQLKKNKEQLSSGKLKTTGDRYRQILEDSQLITEALNETDQELSIMAWNYHLDMQTYYDNLAQGITTQKEWNWKIKELNDIITNPFTSDQDKLSAQLKGIETYGALLKPNGKLSTGVGFSLEKFDRKKAEETAKMLLSKNGGKGASFDKARKAILGSIAKTDNENFYKGLFLGGENGTTIMSRVPDITQEKLIQYKNAQTGREEYIRESQYKENLGQRLKGFIYPTTDRAYGDVNSEEGKKMWEKHLQLIGQTEQAQTEYAQTTQKTNTQIDEQTNAVKQENNKVNTLNESLNETSAALLVVGTRSFDNYELFKQEIEKVINANKDLNYEIVSGGANGADAFAKRYAEENNIPFKEFPADWSKGKHAGFERNKQMHEYISNFANRQVLAFWDGQSKGTAHSFDLAKQFNNPLSTILYNQTNVDTTQTLENLKAVIAYYEKTYQGAKTFGNSEVLNFTNSQIGSLLGVNHDAAVVTTEMGEDLDFDKYIKNFINGIYDGTKEIEQPLINFAQMPIDIVRQILDEHSPSRVAEELGYFFGVGFENGINKSADEIYNAVKELMEKAVLTAQDIIDDMPNLIANKEFNNLLQPSLYNVIPDSDRINEMLMQFGFNPSDEWMPSIFKQSEEMSEAGKAWSELSHRLYQSFKTIDAARTTMQGNDGISLGNMLVDFEKQYGDGQLLDFDRLIEQSGIDEQFKEHIESIYNAAKTAYQDEPLFDMPATNEFTSIQQEIDAELEATKIKIDLEKASVKELIDEYERLYKLESEHPTADISYMQVMEKLNSLGYYKIKNKGWMQGSISESGSFIPNESKTSSGSEQAEQFRKISEDTVEVLSHEGKTESEIVSLIRDEIKAAEELNEVTKEHLILLDKEGKVISDHLGSTNNVNGTFTEEQLARANGGKIQHVHPGKASFFGGKDLSHILQDKAFENIKQVELLWGDSTLSIDKSTLTKQSQSTLLNIMKNVRSALTETYSDNVGGTPSQEAREHINAIEKEIFKSIAQKLNISVSENGQQAQDVTNALSDVDKAIIQRFKNIESSVVQDINPAEIISNETNNLSDINNLTTDSKAYLNKKESVKKLREELNLTEKAANNLFNAELSGSKVGRTYKVQETELDKLIQKQKELGNVATEVAIKSEESAKKEYTTYEKLWGLFARMENANKQVKEGKGKVNPKDVEKYLGGLQRALNLTDKQVENFDFEKLISIFGDSKIAAKELAKAFDSGESYYNAIQKAKKATEEVVSEESQAEKVLSSTLDKVKNSQEWWKTKRKGANGKGNEGTSKLIRQIEDYQNTGDLQKLADAIKQTSHSSLGKGGIYKNVKTELAQELHSKMKEKYSSLLDANGMLDINKKDEILAFLKEYLSLNAKIKGSNAKADFSKLDTNKENHKLLQQIYKDEQKITHEKEQQTEEQKRLSDERKRLDKASFNPKKASKKPDPEYASIKGAFKSIGIKDYTKSKYTNTERMNAMKKYLELGYLIRENKPDANGNYTNGKYTPLNPDYKGKGSFSNLSKEEQERILKTTKQLKEKVGLTSQINQETEKVVETVKKELSLEEQIVNLLKETQSTNNVDSFYGSVNKITDLLGISTEQFQNQFEQYVGKDIPLEQIANDYIELANSIKQSTNQIEENTKAVNKNSNSKKENSNATSKVTNTTGKNSQEVKQNTQQVEENTKATTKNSEKTKSNSKSGKTVDPEIERKKQLSAQYSKDANVLRTFAMSSNRQNVLEYYKTKDIDISQLSEDEAKRILTIRKAWEDAIAIKEKYANVKVDLNVTNGKTLSKYLDVFGNRSGILKDSMQKTYNSADKVSARASKNKGVIRYSSEYLDTLSTLNTEKSKLKNFLNLDNDELEKYSAEILDIIDNIRTLEKVMYEMTNNKDFVSVGLKAMDNALSEIYNKINTNGKASKELKQAYRDLADEIEIIKKSGQELSLPDWNRYTDRLKELNVEFEKQGKYGKSLLQQFGNRIKQESINAISMYFSFYDIIRYARELVTAIQEVDDAMIELKKVSSDSSSAIAASLEVSKETAKDLGATLSDTINATADWSRMGYNIKEAEELARVSVLYQNVGDNIDIDTANESLISTLQGFELNAEDAESIVDKFNEVANNYAIDSAGIGEALQRSAASLNAANTSLSESVALVTATNEIVQDTDAVGNMWKTVSARIRGAETELEDLGEETDDYVKSTSKMRDLIKGMTGVDIMEDENTYKSIYTIVDEIGRAWKDLSDIDQAALLEAMAGKLQSNRLAAVFSNIEHLESAYKTAEESAGSAMREQEHFEEGITYSLNRVKATAQDFATSLISSDLVKGVVDFGNTGLTILDKAIDKFGILGTLLPGIAAGMSAIKNQGRTKMLVLSKYALCY